MKDTERGNSRPKNTGMTSRSDEQTKIKISTLPECVTQKTAKFLKFFTKQFSCPTSCCGAAACTVGPLTPTPPHRDREISSRVSRNGADSDTDIADGGMGFEFPLLQRLLEQLCFDINRNTDCTSKTEDFN